MRQNHGNELYLLRAVSTGIGATVLALAALLVFRFLPGGDEVPAAVFFGLWVITAIGGLIVLRLPWERLFASGAGRRVLYLWSIVDVVLITIVIIAAGDANPSFFGLYFLTTLFFAPTYPVKMQVALFAFTAACYISAAAVVADPLLSPADHFLRVSILGIAAFMVSFIARELLTRAAHEGDARVELATKFADLQKVDELFRAVSELATDYVYAMDVLEDGSLRWDWASAGYTRVLGYDADGSNHQWGDLVHPNVQQKTAESLGRLMRGERVVTEMRVRSKGGEYRCLRTYAQPGWDEEHRRVVRIFGAAQDITEQEHQRDALQRSNSLLKATLESTADGILVVDGAGRIVAFNRKFVTMWKIPQEVVYSRDDEKALHVVLDQLQDPDAFLAKVRALYDDSETESFDELQFKDGRVYERFSQPRIVDGHMEGRVWSFRDITDKRHDELRIRDALEALREADAERRRLLSHLVRAKEDERNRVAADIHDDSVQVMTAAAIDLERLERTVTDPDVASRLAQIESRVRGAVRRLRSMVFELRPPSLVEEGLVPALTMYLEEFTADTGIEYHLKSRVSDDLADDLKIGIYRIAQEALTNVRKHSAASKVWVDVVGRDSFLLLRVADDGIGFSGDPGTAPGHIGVSEMRERAQILGGTFHMSRRAEGGTVIEVAVPHSRTAETVAAGGPS